MDALKIFFEAQHVPTHELVRVRKSKLMRDWWDAFAAPHKRPGEQWPAIRNESMWEVFSSGCVPYLNQTSAKDAFLAVQPSEFLVIPNSKFPVYRCDATACADVFGLLMDFQNFLETEGQECLDTYVMDRDHRWTCVFTHESSWGMGPYYAFSNA